MQGPKKKSESPAGIEPLAFHTPVRCSNHWVTKDSCQAGPYTRFIYSMHPTYGPARNESSIAQCIRALTSLLKVIGSIPVKDSDFFLFPCSRHVDYIFSQIIGCFIKKIQVVNWLIVPLQRYTNIVYTVGREFLSTYSPKNVLI